MTKIRLLPLVLIAVSSLFILKTAGLWLNSSVLFGGVAPAHAQSSSETAERAEAESADAEPQENEAESQNQAETEPPAQIDLPDQEEGDAKTAVLERLRERRQKLDAIEQELTMRENLIGAAEMQLEARIKELKAIEARIAAVVGERESEQQAQLDGLVTMYETMKPKDAARIFNRLELPILIDVVNQMKARKMAIILAAMDSGAAERLTIEIAMRGRQNPFNTEQVANDRDLPKIGEPNPG